MLATGAIVPGTALAGNKKNNINNGIPKEITDRLSKNDGSSFIGGLVKPVTAFYLESDGGDYSKAVNRGFANQRALYFPHRDDNSPWPCNSTFTIPSNCTLFLDRCDIKTDEYIELIRQEGISEFSLQANGVCRIIGPRVGNVGEPASSGLVMIDCIRPTFGSNGVLIFQDWSDCGWKASSTSFTGAASFGVVSNVITRNNGVGWDLGDGDGCEYWTLNNIRSFSNFHGAYFKSPNTMVVGGGCTHNVTNGLHVMSGFNDGHSSFVGFNMNHNGANNIYALGINNGLSFVGCQSFDDGEGSNTGKFKIESCKGISWVGGELNVDFEVTGICSANSISNAYFTSDSRAYHIMGDDLAKKQLFFNRCTTPSGSGSFAHNSFTNSYTVGYTSVDQAVVIPVAVATAIPVTEVIEKTIGSTIYDSATKRWVARNPGKYVMDVYLDVGSSDSSMPTGVYISIKINGVQYMYIPCFTLSETDAFGKATVEFENLATGDYIEALAYVPSGNVSFRPRTRVSMHLLV
ncbi:hypothetical protein ACEUCL_17130 [Aeromonas dhakensis]|uniref:hypothetical protein n=1 Tax=Aeromonas dhakensis TaxID=196024 RepID=UPI0038D045B4